MLDTSSATETITTYYEKDHDRLDNLFKTFQAEKRTDFPKAKAAFKEFKIGLQRHIIWEEDILFPFFEQKTGMFHGGPTEVMRYEHKQIKGHLEAIHEKVKVADPETDPLEAALLNVLSVHNEKEEAILYPAIDQAASDADRQSIFGAMENVPESRFHHCC